jgi:DNA-directed RNA polymerase subunit RPC12/RpoP
MPTPPPISGPPCPVCETNTLWNDEAVALGACSECATQLDLVPLPPSRRPALPCARCGHARLVRAIPRAASHMFAAHSFETVPLWLAGKAIRPESLSGRGMLEAFICCQCGFVEWYCNDPANLPIGPLYMTELIDTSTHPPYR